MPLVNRRTLFAGLTAAVITEIRAETPHSAFGPTSTTEEVTQGMNLRGNTAVVTGCNTGLGFESMRVLALRGAHVIGTEKLWVVSTQLTRKYLG